MIHHRSRGSIASFVIVGLLLLGLVAGAIHGIKRGIFSGVIKPAETVNTATPDKTAVSDKNDTQNSQSSNAQKTDELSEALRKQSDAEKKAKEQNQAAANTPTASTNTPAPATVTTVPTTGASLPQTGPAEDMAMSIAGVGLLAGFVVAYRRSRALI